VEPTAIEGQYRFQAALNVAFGTAQSLTITATDSAGNSSQTEYLLVLANNVQLEWITPADNTQLVLENTAPTQTISARVSNVSGSEAFIAYLEGAQAQASQLSYSQGILSGSLSLPDTAGSYTFWIEVQDNVGNTFARASRNIVLTEPVIVPLAVTKVTPADGAQNAEPNGFISIFFNNPIDLTKLVLDIRETIHGFSYVDADPPGVDGLQAKGHSLEQIDRDYEVIPGILSLLPNSSGVAFYPERDLGYGASIFVTATYDGVELTRQQFKVRPRPTFIEGVIADNLGQAVTGVEISIPELGRSTTSNNEGAYSFGYGDNAERNIASGRYQLFVNRGLKDPRFGSYRTWINIQNGARNTVASIPLPLANTNIAFSHLQSGAQAVINGGEVNLDLTNTRLTFNDGLSAGSIRLQFLPLSAVTVRSFDPRYTPMWFYAVQPVGIEVDGAIAFDFALPAYQGAYDYAPLENELVLLLGMDAEALVLAPVGVGKTLAGHRISSVGATSLKSLDYIAYARVFPEQRPDLQAYTDGEISLEELRTRLQLFQFIPPANEQEALERLQ
jgi:hypothetical protein